MGRDTSRGKLYSMPPTTCGFADAITTTNALRKLVDPLEIHDPLRALRIDGPIARPSPVQSRDAMDANPVEVDPY